MFLALNIGSINEVDKAFCIFCKDDDPTSTYGIIGEDNNIYVSSELFRKSLFSNIKCNNHNVSFQCAQSYEDHEIIRILVSSWKLNIFD